MSVHTERLWNRSFLLCVFNNLFVFTYYFAMLTVLPIYILKDLGGSIADAGLAITLFLASSIAIRPFVGLIIQKLGKRISMRGTSLLFAVFAFAYLLIDSMWSLLLIRFLHGIWFSILTTVAVPVVNDFIPEQRKGEGMGYYVMSTNLGLVFGPLLALSIIQWFNFEVLFAVLAVMISIGLVFCWTLKLSDDFPKPQVIQQKKSLSLHDLVELKVLSVSFVALLTAFAYSSVMTFITVFAESKNLFEYTSLFFIVFAASMLLIRPFVGRLYDRRGPSAVIYPAFVLFAVGMVVIAFISNQWILWLSAVLIGMGYGSLFPCLQTLAIQSVSKERMGHAISTFFTLFDIGLAIGSLIMGVLVAYSSYESTFLFCAVTVVITMLIYRQTVALKHAKFKKVKS